jgi:hypothetical protein
MCVSHHILIRVQTQPVGRIYGVSHNNVELFALRRLLNVVKGAASFEDLATHAGVLYSTFREACMAHGLLDNNMEHVDALREIIDSTVSMDILRIQFARILVHGAPSDAQSLFNQFVDDLCSADDGGNSIDVALLAIENEMNALGRSLSDADFGFVAHSAQQHHQPSAAQQLMQLSFSIQLAVYSDNIKVIYKCVTKRCLL